MLEKYCGKKKNSLFADDLLLYLSDVDGSLINALNIILRFVVYSRFKVNWSKSIVFPFDPLFTPRMPPDVPLQMVSKFKYLGVEIQLPLSTYIPNNLSPLIAQLRNNLQTWSKLALNLLGRINIFKIIYLPRFLYIFWHVPIYIPKKLFTEINMILSLFLWGSRPTSISLDTLYLPIQAGELALPNLQCYYLTSQ